ncbi:MAG: HAD-IIB family hydrolase [Minisyncoccia bacterium]
MTKLVIFDLDGTLAESKQQLTSGMAEQLSRLLAVTKVAIISGGALSQFLKQVVAQLPVGTELANLYLLPTSGAALYEFQNDDWKKIYEERLSEKEKDTIEAAMMIAIEKTKTIDLAKPAWGDRVEYRGGQVSLSALGQHAPIAEKKAWDPDHSKRHALQAMIAERLPAFSVKIGGMTTIDVTKRNIDKAYGVHQLCERLRIREEDSLYVGDELGDGGNDEAVYKTDVHARSVKDPIETAYLIESLLATS